MVGTVYICQIFYILLSVWLQTLGSCSGDAEAVQKPLIFIWFLHGISRVMNSVTLSLHDISIVYLKSTLDAWCCSLFLFFFWGLSSSCHCFWSVETCNVYLLQRQSVQKQASLSVLHSILIVSYFPILCFKTGVTKCSAYTFLLILLF